MNTDAELFREALEYFPDTGQFVWKISPAKRAQAGSVAGSISVTGYWIIGYRGNVYRAHRLAWLLMTGEWPTQQIDHKNLNKTDNRWINLREATHSQNGANRIGHGKLPKGVRLSRNGKFEAQIKKNRKYHYLGTFKTAEEASIAYAIAAKEYFREFARAE